MVKFLCGLIAGVSVWVPAGLSVRCFSNGEPGLGLLFGLVAAVLLLDMALIADEVRNG